MASQFVNLRPGGERKTPTIQLLVIKTTTVFIAILTSILAFGCGTFFSYRAYSRCVDECDYQFKEDSLRQKCKAKCFTRFNYSDSPLRNRSDIPVQGSDHDKIKERFPFPKEDGKIE
jgi:hypothetical protein